MLTEPIRIAMWVFGLTSLNSHFCSAPTNVLRPLYWQSSSFTAPSVPCKHSSFWMLCRISWWVEYSKYWGITKNTRSNPFDFESDRESTSAFPSWQNPVPSFPSLWPGFLRGRGMDTRSAVSLPRCSPLHPDTSLFLHSSPGGTRKGISVKHTSCSNKPSCVYLKWCEAAHSPGLGWSPPLSPLELLNGNPLWPDIL